MTANVVANQIALGGWRSCPCPLCDASAATWSIENADAARYICATCQRVVLSGPERVGLPNNPARKRELRRLAAASADVAEFL